MVDSTTGILCHRRIIQRLKYKIYRSAVRPAALYDSECERHLAKVIALHSVVTCHNYIRNEERGLYRLSKNCQRDIFDRVDMNPNIDVNIQVDGKRPKGRPIQRWLDMQDGNCEPRPSRSGIWSSKMGKPTKATDRLVNVTEKTEEGEKKTLSTSRLLKKSNVTLR